MFPCPHCPNSMGSKKSLKTHIREKHKENHLKVKQAKPKKVKCIGCSKVFATKSDMEQHFQVKHSKYKFSKIIYDSISQSINNRDGNVSLSSLPSYREF